MEFAGEMQNNSEEKSAISASKKRAENRRKKLLMNSEDRMNRIMGFTGGNKNDGEKIEVDRHVVEPRIHVDLERTEAWSTPVPSKGLPSFPSEVGSGIRHSEGLESKGSPLSGSRDTLGSGVEVEGLELRHRSRGELPADGLSRSPRRGLQQYLSRFDEAFKLRDQLANDKPAQESGSGPEELEAFRLFRLVGSVVLAIVVRMFVCKYLSIFAPFLTLQLAYMGLYKYFPKGEKKMKSTVLTAALLLSGIPAEVINRSMDTYRKMGDVFTDLCVYFFSFIVCHELVLLFGSEIP